MRMFLESSSVNTLSSILVNSISTYLSFGFMIIMTTLTIYALARILDWSSSKPLPTAMQTSTFNVLLASLVAATAALLVIGVDLGRALGMLGAPILSIVGAPDILPLVLAGLASAAMLLVFRWLRTG